MGMAWEALMPCYGLAEATVGATLNPPDRGPAQGPGGYVSAGRPMPGVELRLPEDSRRGPVQLRGDGLFSGYHTQSGFEPVAAGEWYDTGDDGFAHDGELYVIGRRAEVLTLAGRNVFAEDVESVAHHAGGQPVRGCAAFRSAETTGRFGLMVEVDPRLVRGAAAARELARQIQASVTQTLGTRLTPLLMVRLGTIPRTTSGKAQRAQCRAIHASGEIDRRIIAELS
jgi:fatty-acyl-CoA synthase